MTKENMRGKMFFLAYNPSNPLCSILHLDQPDCHKDVVLQELRIRAAEQFGINYTEVGTVELDTSVEEVWQTVQDYLAAVEDKDRLILVQVEGSEGATVGILVSTPCPDPENMRYMEYAVMEKEWKYIQHWQERKEYEAHQKEEAELIDRIRHIEVNALRPMRAILNQYIGNGAAEQNDIAHFLKYHNDEQDIRLRLAGVRARIIELRVVLESTVD